LHLYAQVCSLCVDRKKLLKNFSTRNCPFSHVTYAGATGVLVRIWQLKVFGDVVDGYVTCSTSPGVDLQRFCV